MCVYLNLSYYKGNYVVVINQRRSYIKHLLLRHMLKIVVNDKGELSGADKNGLICCSLNFFFFQSTRIYG